MWFRNTETGCEWNVDAETAQRLSRDPVYEQIDNPDENRLAVQAADGVGDMFASPTPSSGDQFPRTANNSPRATAAMESTVQDARQSHNENSVSDPTQPKPATKRTRKSSK